MKIIIMAWVILIASCSTASTIQKVSSSKSAFDDAAYEGEIIIIDSDISDDDAYRIFHQAATGFVSVQSVRGSAEKRANQFCGKKGKVMYPLREHTSTPPHILGCTSSNPVGQIASLKEKGDITLELF